MGQQKYSDLTFIGADFPLVLSRIHMYTTPSSSDEKLLSGKSVMLTSIRQHVQPNGVR